MLMQCVYLPGRIRQQGFVVVAFMNMVVPLTREYALLLQTHVEKAEADGYPVQVVGDDRTKSSRVLPSEHGIEDTPEASTVEIGVAALQKIQLGHSYKVRRKAKMNSR